MKVLAPYTHVFLAEGAGAKMLRHIERCGRICYKSEDRITDGSAERFVKNIIQRGHEAVLEHASLSVLFVVDRGISHEIVRHRLASYCQESTRYCNYNGTRFGSEIMVIAPPFFKEGSLAWYDWYEACQTAERRYLSLINNGATAEQARDVLPTSLKTELMVTANLREWRNILRLRTSPAAHPQIRQVMVPLLGQLKTLIPVAFDDIMCD